MEGWSRGGGVVGGGGGLCDILQYGAVWFGQYVPSKSARPTVRLAIHWGMR